MSNKKLEQLLAEIEDLKVYQRYVDKNMDRYVEELRAIN